MLNGAILYDCKTKYYYDIFIDQLVDYITIANVH